MAIHPTAIIDSRAELDPTVEVGPYVIIEGPVKVGPRTRLGAHAYLTGDTEIGPDNHIHMGAVIGHEPQDLNYQGAPTFCRIGARNVIREYAQVHRGTAEGSGTVVGDECFLMAQSHVAHNCRLGHRVILANCALLGGYVEIEDGAFISGAVVVHQYVRIGKLVILQGGSRIGMHVPPYMIAAGHNNVAGVNLVGLKRWPDIHKDDRTRIREAYRILYRQRLTPRQAADQLKTMNLGPHVDYLVRFVERALADEPPYRRGLCAPKGGAAEE